MRKTAVYIIAALAIAAAATGAVYAQTVHANDEPVIIANNEIDYIIGYILSDEWGTPSHQVSLDNPDRKFECAIAIGRDAQQLVDTFADDTPDEVSIIQGADRGETAETTLHWIHQERPTC